MNGFRISRSLARRLRRQDYEVTFDRDFDGVIDACADRRETWINSEIDACADRRETWINSEIRALFAELHRRGHAHSIEVWMQDELVGGVYGLEVGGTFCGESMFSRRRDGSKIALAWLIDLLKRAGFILFDTQFLTEHLASLGAIEIPRQQYRAQLATALLVTPDLAGTPLAGSGQEVVQRSTQTS